MKISGDLVYLIDTYAWVEYFIGSDKGKIVREILEDEKNVILTPECVLAELKGWAIRENIDFEELYQIVRKLSDIQCLTTNDWLDAASIRTEIRKNMKDFGMIDALIVAQQKRFNCKVISGDPHFEHIKNAMFLS
ncbi:MAG: putative nucleic acid-binding protein, contains PIN domain [Candidatus Methanomarinus sp.]|nr:MAG: putative nucleic acid-binding protein, contains PIN domain [ANME-2 cluster archaeon]KAF5424930.1 putative nucleic acid-binding protein, contains PIN domain [ANME-2 cluster archaeon]